MQLFLIILSFVYLPIFDIYPHLFLWYDYNVNEKLATDPSPQISMIFIILSIVKVICYTWKLHLIKQMFSGRVLSNTDDYWISLWPIKYGHAFDINPKRSELYASKKWITQDSWSNHDSPDTGNCTRWSSYFHFGGCLSTNSGLSLFQSVHDTW